VEQDDEHNTEPDSLRVCVCVFAEQLLRNGEVEMRARDEEIRFLKMQLAEEQRTLALMKRALPSKTAMEQEIVALQIEVSRSLVAVCLSVCLPC